VKLGYVIVYTGKVDQSVTFYEKAFGLQRRFVHESGQYAEVETGETTLAFVADELAALNVPGGYRKNTPGEAPAGIEVALVSKDVENAYRHAVENGAVPVKSPIKRPWGQVVGYVRDNNGVLVELATPMG
jgi:lactoylglutathione lyase